MGLLKSAAPFYCYPELSLISFVKTIVKYVAFAPSTGTKSQIHSQDKLTTLRFGNRKIQHKNEILKAKE
jgi:hypothetical protein